MADYVSNLLSDLESTNIKWKKDIDAFKKGISDINSTINELKQNLDYAWLDKFIKDVTYNFKELGKWDRFFDGITKSSKGYVLNISDRKLERNDAKVMKIAIDNFNNKYNEKKTELKDKQNTIDLSYESNSSELLWEYNKKINTLSKNQVEITKKQNEIVILSGRYQEILSEIKSSTDKLNELNKNSQIQNSSEKTKLENNIKKLNKEKQDNLSSRTKLNNEIITLKENLPTQEDISSSRSTYTDSINNDITNIENKAWEKLDELANTEVSREDMISIVKESKQENKTKFEDDLKNINEDITQLIKDWDMTTLDEKQENRNKTIEDYANNLSQLNTLENTTYISNINKFDIKYTVITAKKNKIDEVINSLSSQEKIANNTKNSLQENLASLQSLQNQIWNIWTESWNIEDSSPFNIDQEITSINQLIEQKTTDIENINTQLSPLQKQSSELKKEQKNISTYIDILKLQQREHLIQQEMDIYKIIWSEGSEDSWLIPDTKKQVDDITTNLTEIDSQIIQKEKEKTNAWSTTEKQTITQQFEDLKSQKAWLENAKKTFQSDLDRYQSTYNTLSSEKDIIDGQIKEIDPDWNKTEEIPKELQAITPQTVGMIYNDNTKYENIA